MAGLREADGQRNVEVEIAGFDLRYAEKMFSPFQRLHSGGEYEGTGIGLTIVDRIVSRHGCRAWAEGEIGRGAVVYFTVD